MARIRRSAGRRKFYIAYGSNLDKARMAQRCPQAVPYASGWLDGWELIYRGSKTGNYATIRPAKKEFVPVGIWQITQLDEAMLDRYEGYPTFYHKKTITARLDTGELIEGLVYIMRKDAKPGPPSEFYIDTIYQGYKDFGLDFTYLRDSLYMNLREIRKGRP